MFIFWGYTAGGSLYHVADCSTECVFVAEAFYSRKICAKALLSVSAQIQEDLDRVGLQSRYEISVKNYKSALCFFPALVLQPTSQIDRWERRGRDEGRVTTFLWRQWQWLAGCTHTVFICCTGRCLLTSVRNVSSLLFSTSSFSSLSLWL